MRRETARDLLIALIVIVVLASPALFSSSGFVDDWVNHLWLAWQQSREIRAQGWPSLFVHAYGLGVFYPNFLFYGGTLYALAGALMLLTGAPVAVFVGFLVAAFATAYGGTLWIARQAGVTGWPAHLPAIVVVTGAYYLSIAYGRGSWPELVATSAIPLLIAAALRIVRRGVALGPVLALAVTTIIWSGSHNISLVWGATFIALVAVAFALAFGTALDRVQLRRVGVVFGILVLGVLVNGWFLLGDLRYAAHTGVGQFDQISAPLSDPFSRWSIIFNPFRARASTNPYIRSHFTELPVLVMGWILIAGGLVARGRWAMDRRLRRMLVALIVIVIALLVLLVDDGIWPHLPSPLRHIQFTFRLETYIVMAIAGCVIVLLAGIGNGRPVARGLRLGLALTCAFGLGLSVWQVWNSDAGYYAGSRAFLTDRSRVLRYPYRTPPTWYVFDISGSFRDVTARVVPTQGMIRLDPARVRGDRITQDVLIPPGSGPVATNIASPAYIVSVRGLPVAGRTGAGFLALDRPADHRAVVRLTVQRADSAALRFGPVLTVLGLIGLAAVCVAVIVIRRRPADA